MSAPLVDATGLHVYYGTSHILHGVDIAVAPGETLGLMGRNGMGKTTLLRALVGLTPPRHGEIRIRGQVITGAPPYRVARQGIALVPEGRGIFASLSVREHLELAARPGPDGRRDWSLPRVLDLFPRLAERIAYAGTQLSGGEQQMLTIGRALMTNPELLILDEATEGLAPLVSREIWRIVRLIRDSGIATILVDKNFAAVSALADRCLILVKGNVVYSGTAQELIAQPELHQRHLGV